MKNLLSLSFAMLFVLISFSQEVLRGPYLQNLTSKSIHVMWRTSDSLIGKVWVGTNPDNLEMEFSNSIKTLNHNVTISGLSSSSTYYYAIGYDDVKQFGGNETHQFRTSPAEGVLESVKMWVTGDFGTKTQSQIDVRESFEKSSYIKDTDFWLWLGDNVYDDGTDKEYQERIFSTDYGYDSILRFLPFYPIPGNHDYNSVNRFDNPNIHNGPYYRLIDVPTEGEAGGIPSKTELYYSFDYSNIHFVALNSEVFQYTFFDNTPMIQWLKEDLQKNKKEWTIVYWHQTPYTDGSHKSDDGWELFMTAMRERINPIVENFGVDLVLCGHTHVYERSYLISNHFGTSNSFRADKHIVQGTSGYYDLGEHYTKYLYGENAKKGTVYVNLGNSGRNESGPPLNHPVHYYTDGGDGVSGSMIIDVVGNRLDATYMKKDGSIGEVFTIIKPDGTDTSTVTSFKPVELSEDISVFPIPSSGKLYANFSLKEGQKVSINLLDISGKYVSNLYSNSLSSGKNSLELNINRNGVPSGAYFLQFEGEKGAVSTQKIILIK